MCKFNGAIQGVVVVDVYSGDLDKSDGVGQ